MLVFLQGDHLVQNVFPCKILELEELYQVSCGPCKILELEELYQVVDKVSIAQL
jgi:hypothetical protein